MPKNLAKILEKIAAGFDKPTIIASSRVREPDPVLDVLQTGWNNHADSWYGIKTKMSNIGAKSDNRSGYTIPAPSQDEIAGVRINRLYRQSPLKEMTPYNAEIWASRNPDNPAARQHQRIMSQIAEVRQGLKETGKNQPLKPAYKPAGGSPLTRQGKVIDRTKEHPGQWHPQLPGIND